MMFARLNPDTGAPEARDFAIDPGRKGWLELIVDAQPVPSPTQAVVNAGIVVGVTEAHQTWALADKSAAQIEAEALQQEKAQLATYLADLQTQIDISNATRAALTNAQRINELETDTRATMRAVKFLLRRDRGR